MKKIIAAILVISMCMCLFACDSSLKLTEEEIISALEPAEDDVLKTTGGKNNIKSFSYTVKADYTSYLNDYDFVQTALLRVILSKISKTSSPTLTEYFTYQSVMAVGGVVVMFREEDDDKIPVDYACDILCKGETIELNGWKISAKINADSITITASK